MNTILILNPEGNNGNGTITQYTGRGPGILEHIHLIDLLIDANEVAQAIIEEAKEQGESTADISEPANVAATVQRTLKLQAIYN